MSSECHVCGRESSRIAPVGVCLVFAAIAVAFGSYYVVSTNPNEIDDEVAFRRSLGPKSTRVELSVDEGDFQKKLIIHDKEGVEIASMMLLRDGSFVFQPKSDEVGQRLLFRDHQKQLDISARHGDVGISFQSRPDGETELIVKDKQDSPVRVVRVSGKGQVEVVENQTEKVSPTFTSVLR